jgi:hypothetical protein
MLSDSATPFITITSASASMTLAELHLRSEGQPPSTIPRVPITFAFFAMEDVHGSP